MQTKCHLQNVYVNELLLLKFINYYFRRAHLTIKKLTAKVRVETSLCIYHKRTIRLDSDGRPWNFALASVCTNAAGRIL